MNRLGWIIKVGLVVALFGAVIEVAGQQAAFINTLKTDYRSGKPFGTKAMPYKTWSEWQQANFPLQPDFKSLAKQRKSLNRQEIWRTYQDWIIGHQPQNFRPRVARRFTVLDSQSLGDVIYRQLAISVDLQDGKAPVQIMLKTYEPARTSKRIKAGKYPVFMTQYNHQSWAMMAARRGYWGIAYAAADKLDAGDTLASRYPEADWSSLHRRAVIGRLVVDWLVQQPQADTSKVALAGHSRNGKQSLILAAMDRRIKAIISSSAGTGGDTDWQFTGPQFNSETIEKLTGTFPDWFLPKVRWFINKEDSMPVEQHQLMQLIAPRRLMVISSYNENQINPWAVNQTLKAAAKAWNVKSGNLVHQLALQPDLYLRNGRHAVDEDDIETMIDWVDGCFGFGKPVSWPDPYPQMTGVNNRPQVRFVAPLERAARLSEPHFQQLVIGFPETKLSERMDFGSYDGPGPMLNVSVYGPKDFMKAGKKYPVVIWCHEAAHQAAWQRLPAYWIDSVVAKGYLLLCWEMPGFGTRWPSVNKHTRRYASLPDLKQAISELDVLVRSVRQTNYVDTSNISLAGHLLGGQVVASYLGSQEGASTWGQNPKAYIHHAPNLPADDLGLMQSISWVNAADAGYWRKIIRAGLTSQRRKVIRFKSSIGQASSDTSIPLTGYGRLQDWPLWRWLD